MSGRLRGLSLIGVAVSAVWPALSVAQLSPSAGTDPLQTPVAQTGSQVAPGAAVTGTPTAVTPRSEASLAAMKSQSAAVRPRQGQGVAAAAAPSNGPQAGVFGPGPGCDLFPAPSSTGTNEPLSYFGPPPSSSNPSLVGPVQLLKSGVVDAQKGTVTLPLYKGYLRNSKTPIWYILTDTSDPDVATELGLNVSAKLKFVGPGVRTANFNSKGELIFNGGTVDFRPNRVLVPGPADNPFPPLVSKAGSVGDRNYSPLVRVVNGGGIIYNASIVATGPDEASIDFPDGNVDYSKVHDEVLAIDPYKQVVTLQLVNGFSFGRPLWYLSLDASTELVAGIESNTYAPLMAKVHTGNDDTFGSGVERIFISTNGARGCDNPRRQGLAAAFADGHRPNNTFGGIPTLATDYSPLWNGQLYEWTPDSVSKGYVQQLREEFQLLTYVQDGLITGPAGVKFGDSVFSINCPPVQRLE